MKKLFLVDAYALMFKYYYAFLGRPMRNRAGMNTSVVFGFVKFLRDILKRERPDLLGVAFDPKGGSFRREIYPEYKANRAETPEDIVLSVPYVKRVLEAMCIPVLEVEGYEADDVIGTLSQKGVEAGYEVFMVTPDKDYGQLVRDHCKIYKQKGADGSIEIVDREAIPHAAIFSPCLPRISAAWSRMFSTVPHSPTSLQALFSPMPGTPGMLSDASPHRARMSRTSVGSSMPYLRRIASRSTISIEPSAPFCL